MEPKDRELINTLSKTNFSLKRLAREHDLLEELLMRYEKRVFLTPSEEMEAKRLKKEKLRGVDEMMRIISEHKYEIDSTAAAA